MLTNSFAARGSLSMFCSGLTFCRGAVVTETRKSMQICMEVTKTVARTTKYLAFEFK